MSPLKAKRHKPQSNTKTYLAIGLIVVVVLGAIALRISTTQSSDWDFYVSVHYGDESLSNEMTKTMVVEAKKSGDRVTAFRLTSECSFSDPMAEPEKFMTVMTDQPEVIEVDHRKFGVIIVKLGRPLGGDILTEFNNFMMEGVVATRLNRCGGVA